MPDTTYYAPGQWNFTCDLCGGSFKSSTGEKTWDGFYVCRNHKERRNPQDFVRGPKAELSIPWSRPEGEYINNNQVIDDWTSAVTFRLLQENGFAILQEDSSLILRT